MRAEKDRIGRFAGKTKSVAEFLSNAINAFKDQPVVEAIAKVAPWAEVVGDAAADSLPAVKFVVNLVKGFTEPRDYDDLAWLACSTAYQQSVAHALEKVGSPAIPTPAADPEQDFQRLLKQDADSEHDFTLLSFGQALEHSFIRESDKLFEAFAIGAGFDEDQRRSLIREVHGSFVTALKGIVCHPSLMDRYRPLVESQLLGKDEAISRAWLEAHVAYLWRQYNEAPVLGREPYSLADVYIETECGQLTWGEIRGGDSGMGDRDREERSRADPVKDGGRHPLIPTVIKLMGQEKFSDAIVVQGVAGSGKSAFSLRLANELAERGLAPVRVRLTHLRCSGDVLEDIAQAVLIRDPGGNDGPSLPKPADLFLGNSLFRERTRAPESGIEICRYVLILDGWDEISISASEGFRQRLTRMLEQLRNALLRNIQDPPVRIVLTGRPSPDLTDSGFLLKNTPVLTLRNISADQLRVFTNRIGRLLGQASTLPESSWPLEFRWSLGNPARFDALFDRYEQEQVREEKGGVLEVLGLPLLVQIALRVMAQEERDLAALAGNPTKLYRRLIDITTPHAGKGAEDSETEKSAHLSGWRLRKLLRSTASAITVHGREEIGFDELSIRLEELGHDLESEVDAIDNQEHGALHSLVVSYYFKGGRTDQGCEFLHKSFREYLHAEKIVSVLRSFTVIDMTKVPIRVPYWKDFDESDPRYELSRTLGKLLAPHWTTPEVLRHLYKLIVWEIECATINEDDPDYSGYGPPAKSLAWIPTS